MPSRAYSFYGLNVVRALSIISLILVFSSTVFVIVNNVKAVNFFEANKNTNGTLADMEDCEYIENSSVPNLPAGLFWALRASLLIIFQTIILHLSDSGWPNSVCDRFFPVLGSGFGLGPLGIFQCLIATQILSHHADDFTLVSAFFLFAIGCLNMLLGLIFRESAKQKRSIFARRDAGKDVLPTTMNDRKTLGPTGVTGVMNEKSMFEYDSGQSTEKSGYGFGRLGEKAAGLRGFVLQKPGESLPRYATPPPPVRPARTGSLRSTTSSFSSPPPPRWGSRHSRSDSSSYYPSSSSRAGTPVFKSSATAL